MSDFECKNGHLMTGLTCKKCGKKIITFKDFHSRTRCKACYNKYHRDYYDKNFKTLVRKYSSNGRLSIEKDTV